MDCVQKNLYKMLEEIDTICRKYKITYYLGGGSALGAVRGNAFLPWDDDVDIYITRKNYNKLCEVIQDNLPEGRSFITQDNTPLHYNPIAMYVDDTTTCIIKSRLLAGKACGQVIEFLVLDPLPTDHEKEEEYKKMMLIYTELLSPYLLLATNVIEKKSCWDQKLYEAYYRKAKRLGKEVVLKEIEENYLSYPDEECERYCMRWGYRILLFEKKDLGVPRYELFESKKFPVAQHAERIFRMAYGDDWMYVPKWQEQVVHNAVKDLDTPFREFLDISEKEICKEDILNAYIRYKEKRVETRMLREQTEKDVAVTRAKIAEITLPMEINYTTQELWELVNDRKFTELEVILKPYFDVVSMPNIKRFSINISVGDEFIEIALRTLIGLGRYFQAKSILERRIHAGQELTNGLKDVKRIVEFCHNISVAQYDEKDSEKAEMYLSEADETYQTMNEYIRCKLWIEAEHAKGTNDWSIVEKTADHAMGIYPEDGEIKKYKADVLWANGLKEEAADLYKEIETETRNGILLLDISKKMQMN